MKTILTILFALLFFSLCFAQQGINYKAVIKDNNGNVVANQTIDIQFTILQGVTNVYQETHSLTTDTNGIAIVNIGEETPTIGTFATIDWANDDHFLNVKINVGAGLVDMGTTQFMAVPYAINALNVKGLEALNEGNGIGWRLKGRNPNNYGNIGFNAIDFSSSDFSSSSKGATGSSAIAMGYSTRASGFDSTAMGNGTTASGSTSTAMGQSTEALGISSTAMGRETEASGSYSTAMGYGSEASGNNSTAMGNNSTASGNNSIAIGVNATAFGEYSIAMGNGTTASGISSTAMGQATDAFGYVSTALGVFTTSRSYAETVLGSYNTDYTPNNASDWDNADRLFVIGNGSNSSNRSNALTVLKNGNIGIGTTTPDYKLEVSGAVNINEGIGSGIALRTNGDEALWYNGNYFSWGYGTGTGYNFFATNVGLGIYNPNVRLDVNGSIEYTGTIIDVSDRRLKENFQSIENPLEKIKQITGLSYNMIDDEAKIREYGVIAQDVQKMFPEMVSVVDEENGYLGVSYIQLIPVLLEAIKEQQQIIDNQNSKIDVLTSEAKQIQSLKDRLSLVEQLLSAEN